MGEVNPFHIYVPVGGRCEDCDIRDALNEMGNPRTNKWTGARLTAGCGGCGGSGVKAEVVVVPHLEASRILTDKQLFVLERRLGSKRYTQRDIARSMGITHRAVQELERRGMATLRGVAKNRVAL